MSRSRVARAKLSVVRTPPREEPPDDALVAGARAGDRRCKEQLYRRHVDYIAGMCVRLLRSYEASEDAVQDSFLIAFARLDELRDPRALRGWLAAIAVSQVHRRLSKQRFLRFFGLDRALDDAPLDELAREDLSVEARSELAALDLVLRELPPKQRIAWMLRHVEGEALESVCAACGCSLATAKRWIAAADARIRARVSLEETTEDAP